MITETSLSILGKFIEFHKISISKIAGTIFFFTLLFIAMSEIFFGIVKTSVIGIAFLLSIGYFIASFIAYIKNKISNSIDIKKFIANLDDFEKQVLRQFRDKNTVNINANFIYEATYAGLIKKGVIIQTREVGQYTEYVPCYIAPKYIECIKQLPPYWPQEKEKHNGK